MKRFDLENGYFVSEIHSGDKPEYIEHLKEKQIYDQTLNIPYPYGEADADWWINHVAEATARLGFAINFAIREPGGRLIGGIGFHDWTGPGAHKAEIGYWLAKCYWGKGIATSAVRALSKHGFEEMRLVRITANIFHFNIGSEKVLRKAGYQFEGQMRSYYKKDGRIFDGRLFALVAGDV